MLDELHLTDAPPFLKQLADARARYTESIHQLTLATERCERAIPEGDALAELVPDERQRALLMQRAIEACAYWDAEMSAAEIRLARLARTAIAFRLDERGG